MDSTAQKEVQRAMRLERQRVEDITAAGRQHNISDKIVQDAIQSGESIAKFRVKVLDELEKRQVDLPMSGGQFSINATSKGKSAPTYSFGRVLRSLISGVRLDGYEGEMDQEMRHQARGSRAQGIGSQSLSNGILVPLGVLGQRAVSQLNTGTGSHVSGLEHMPFLDHLRSKLAITRAGANVITGVNSVIDFPSGDVEGTAGTPGEDSAQADSEMTFRNSQAIPKPIRTLATFSKTLLSVGLPDTDRIIEGTLMSRVLTKLENQILYGAGGTDEIAGLAGLSGVNDGSFGASGGSNVSYQNFLDMITAVSDAKGMVSGSKSFVTTRGVINKGLNTVRLASGSDISLIHPVAGESETWVLDSDRVYYSDEVSRIQPSPDSPSQLVAHDCFYGTWAEMYVILFGNAMEITVDNLTQADKGNVRFILEQNADMVLPRPETFAKARDVVLS